VQPTAEDTVLSCCKPKLGTAQATRVLIYSSTCLLVYSVSGLEEGNGLPSSAPPQASREGWVQAGEETPGAGSAEPLARTVAPLEQFWGQGTTKFCR
jgi:hypothetical protein